MEFLPEDMVLEICGWLSGTDILALRCVCREYSVITGNNSLWRNVVDRDFSDVSSDSLEPMYEMQYQRLLNTSRQPQSLMYAVSHNYLDAIKYLLIGDDTLSNTIVNKMLQVGNLKVLQLIHNILVTYKFTTTCHIINVAVLDWLITIGTQISPNILAGVIESYHDSVVLPVLQWFIKQNILPATIAKLLITNNHKQCVIALINSGYPLTSRSPNVVCEYGQHI